MLRVSLPASVRPRIFGWVADGLVDGPSRLDSRLSPKHGGRGTMVEQNQNASGGGRVSDLVQ